MINYDCIKRKAEDLVESIKEFDASDYFTLNYKETGKFSFTLLCLAAALYGTGYLVNKVIKEVKDNTDNK